VIGPGNHDRAHRRRSARSLVIGDWPCWGADLVDPLAQGSDERRVIIARVPLCRGGFVIAALGWPRRSWPTTSMGGRIAIALALDWPGGWTGWC